MFGSKSQARKAELAAIKAEEAAQVAAEKALAAQAAEEAAEGELREQRRAQREAKLEEARARVADVKDQVSGAKDQAVQAAAGSGLIGLLASALAAGRKAQPVVEEPKSRLRSLRRNTPEPAAAASSAKDLAKERAAQAAGAARAQAENARSWAEPLLETAREKGFAAALPAAAIAKERGSEYLDKGIERAAPRVNAAATNLQPQVDVVRDKIVDQYLPRIVDAINAAAAAAASKTDDAAQRSKAGLAQVADRAQSQVEVVEERRSSGRTILLIGALGAGAFAAYSAWKASQPTEDPWAVATAATPSSTTPAYSTTTPTPGAMPESPTTSTWTNPADSTSTFVAASATGEGVSEAVSATQEEETPFSASLNNPPAQPMGASFDEVRARDLHTPAAEFPADTIGQNEDFTSFDTSSTLPQRASGSQDEDLFPSRMDPAEFEADETVHLDDAALKRFRDRDILPGDNA